MSPRRADTGGRIDRTGRIRFTFDGKPYRRPSPATRSPRRCSPTASRCSAARSNTTARAACSRPASDEPNALVTVLKGEVREPNIPATMRRDPRRADGRQPEPLSFARLRRRRRQPARPASCFGAGFYYKTFMGPVIGPLKGTRFWMFCEHFIRRAAGLGRAGIEPDTARYETHERLLRRAGRRRRPGRADRPRRPRRQAARASSSANVEPASRRLAPTGRARRIGGMPAGRLGRRVSRRARTA